MKTEYERHASARMFENDFLEAASKIHPATPSPSTSRSSRACWPGPCGAGRPR
ncbi:hypothetical protein ACN28S_61990 [Cystobacter fuscus]